jgi:hypothetical protein
MAIEGNFPLILSSFVSVATEDEGYLVCVFFLNVYLIRFSLE